MAIFILLLGTGSLAEAQTSALSLSRYLGGANEDTIRDIAVDANGYIYVTGGTDSTNFPTTTGAYDRTLNTGGALVHDVFVTKLRPDGTILWSTFIGGPNYDRAYALELDAQRNVYIAGRAGAGFPTTTGAVQRTFGGDNNPNSQYGQQDGFVAKVSSDGTTLLWSTYFGGADRSFIRDIALDGAGNVTLAMAAVSDPNPHITPGAFDGSLNGQEDCVVAALSDTGSFVLWATYLGGSGDDGGTPSVKVDSFGNVFVLGFSNSSNMPTTPGAHSRNYIGGGDLHLAKFNAAGQFLWGTYLGGTDSEFSETHGLAVDGAGNAFVAASTKSDDLPTTTGAYQRAFGGLGGSNSGANSNYPGDGFVMKFSASNGALLAGTYLGGRFGDGIEGTAVGPDGGVYISGATYSDDFPATAGAHQTSTVGAGDLFAVHLSPDLSQVLFASYLGGTGVDFGRCATVDGTGALYLAGHTHSSNFPVVFSGSNSYKGNNDGAIGRFAMVGTCLIAGELCDDGDPCTFDDRCDGAGGCLGTLDALCRPCTINSDCADDVGCTSDICDMGRCVHADACADDGLPCNGAEFCDLTARQCAHTGDPCPGFCNAVSGCPCQAPVVESVGPRYLAITPMPPNSSVPASLFVVSPDWPCVSGYLGAPTPFDIDGDGVADGSLAGLVADPEDRAVLTPAQWGGVVYVTGPQIVPSTDNEGAVETVRYSVVDYCGVTSGSAETVSRTWGDADGNGVVNFIDVQFILIGFQGLLDKDHGITIPSLDMGGGQACDTEQVVNIADVQRAILVFQGDTYAHEITKANGACDVCP